MEPVRIPPGTQEMVRAVRAGAGQAIEFVMGRLYGNHPDLERRFGERGRKACREDLGYHLDYLLASLECRSADPFREYVQWLALLLASRNVPVGHLAESLQVLDEYYVASLGAAAAAPLSAILASGAAALATGAPLAPVYWRHLPQPLEQAQAFTHCLLSGERLEAQRILLEAQRREDSLVEAGVRVVQPAMYEIGLRWQQNRITVAQEHLASAIVQNALAHAYAMAEFAPPLGRKALFSCVQGNRHSLGLRLVADAFALAGWEVQFLGADTPDAALRAQVDAWEPELVGLSVSLPQQVATVRDLVGQLRAEFPARRPAVMVGGLATNAGDGLWKATAADLWAPTSRDALHEAP